MSTILPGNQESAALALDGGMYGLLARRQSMMEVEPFIEHPDCIRVDFETSEENATLNIGYYTAPHVDIVILDGASIPKKQSGAALQVTVPNTGTHILYLHLYEPMPSNHGFGFPLNCSYVRFPYNTYDMLKGGFGKGGWNLKWDRIDILDSNYIAQVKANSYGTFSQADVIRVPIGTKQLYADAGLSSVILDKIVEHNFYFETA